MMWVNDMKKNRIFENSIPEKNIKIKKHDRSVELNLTGKSIDLDTLYKIECFFLGIIKKKINTVYFKMNFEYVNITANFVLLEYIIADFLQNKDVDLKIEFNIDHRIISYNFYQSSILKKFVDNEIDKDEYISRVFNKRNKFYTSNSFRWYISMDDSKTETVSILGTELEFFLNNKNISNEIIDNIIEITTELASNSLEHAKADVIIQCFIHKGAYNKLRKEQCDLIDITIVDFSKNKLHTTLKNRFKVSSETIPKKVYQAYKFHSGFFNEDYDEDSFFVLSTFQNKVTTRNNELQATGGTGLTTFIQTIAPLVNDDRCFLNTGNIILNFNREYLGISGDNVGFNKEKNYIGATPHKDVFKKSKYDFNGTVYNILLGMARSEDDENN